MMGVIGAIVGQAVEPVDARDMLERAEAPQASNRSTVVTPIRTDVSGRRCGRICRGQASKRSPVERTAQRLNEATAADADTMLGVVLAGKRAGSVAKAAAGRGKGNGPTSVNGCEAAG